VYDHFEDKLNEIRDPRRTFLQLRYFTVPWAQFRWSLQQILARAFVDFGAGRSSRGRCRLRILLVSKYFDQGTEIIAWSSSSSSVLPSSLLSFRSPS
jgi:hypothetical protein